MTSGTRKSQQPNIIKNRCTGDVYLSIGTIGWSKTWNGQDSPKDSKGKLLLRDNPYSMQFTEVVDDTCKVVVGHNPDGSLIWYPGTVASCAGWTNNAEPLDPIGNDELKSFNSMVNKIRGHTFNANEFLANGKESLETINDVARRINDSIVEALRGNYLRALQRLFDAVKLQQLRANRLISLDTRKDRNSVWANNRLMWEYGIKPLLDDVKAAAEALASILENTNVNTGFVGIREKLQYDKRTKSSRYRKVRSKMKYVGTLNISQKLNLNNPASFLWEAARFSFVADWFLPIGDYLEAVGDITIVQGQTYTKSVKEETVWRVNPAPSIIGGGNAFTKSVSYNRTVHSAAIADLPLPSYVGMEGALSFKRALNALALLQTTMRSLPENF